MGSHIVTAMTEQRGSASTSDDTSTPITQHTIAPSADSTTLIEQRGVLQTAVDVQSKPISTPIEQVGDLIFPKASLQGAAGSIVEQVGLVRSSLGSASPIEQLDFEVSSSSIMEQRDVQRATVRAQPIEQDDEASSERQLNQYDFAERIFPPCYSIKNPVNTNILWIINHYGYQFDTSSIIFRVNGIAVQDNDEFVVTVIANGLQLEYDPPADFDYNSMVQLYLTIQDTDSPPSNMRYNCYWYTVPDTKSPTVRLISPVCGESNVDVLEPVVFDVLDVGEGIDLSTITFSVEGVNVCDNLSFAGMAVVNSGTGYRGTWTHVDRPFWYDSNVTVTVTASDLAEPPNSIFFVCDFDVEQSIAPDFINFDPAPCESVVDRTTGLTFEIYGNIDGVDISTLEVRVDQKLRRVLVTPKVLRS